jgi:hypothetical protein
MLLFWRASAISIQGVKIPVFFALAVRDYRGLLPSLHTLEQLFILEEIYDVDRANCLLE